MYFLKYAHSHILSFFKLLKYMSKTTSVECRKHYLKWMLCVGRTLIIIFSALIWCLKSSAFLSSTYVRESQRSLD